MSIHWPLQRSSKRRIQRRPHDDAPETPIHNQLSRLVGNQRMQRLISEGTVSEKGTLNRSHVQREPAEVAEAPTTVEHPSIVSIEQKLAKLEATQAAIEVPGKYSNKMWTEMAPTEANAIARLGGEKGIKSKVAAALKKEVARRKKKKEAALTDDETAQFNTTKRKELIDDQLSRLDPSNYQRYREGAQAQNTSLVDGIEEVRGLVNSLNANALGMDGAGLADLKAGFFVRLNRVSPYFQQMSNTNYLPNNQSKDASWTRTCNLTSLSMAINALGAQQADFGGDAATLIKVATSFDASLDSIDKLNALRMPDFLQLVGIYMEYQKIANPSGDFKELVKKAQTNAAGRNTSGEFLAEVAALFGVKAQSKWDIASAGAALRNDKGKEEGEKNAIVAKIAKKKKEMAPLEKKEKAKTISPDEVTKLTTMRSELAKLEEELGAKKASIKEYDDKTKKQEKLDAYELDVTEVAFRDSVIAKITPLVAAGKQIMSNRPGHYVRLQEVTQTGIVVDDPADPGKNVPLTWKEANRIGHFWHYIVLEK